MRKEAVFSSSEVGVQNKYGSVNYQPFNFGIIYSKGQQLCPKLMQRMNTTAAMRSSNVFVKL